MAEEKKGLEAKDVLSFIGFENVNDIEELKSRFNEKYVPTETHKTTLGEINGKVTHAIKKNFKEIGIELSADELKDVSTTDLPALYTTKAKEKFDDLQNQTKLTKDQLESELGKDLETLSSEFTEFKTNVVTENKNREINTRLGAAKGSLRFSDKVDDFTKKGFHVTVAEKYKFEVEDGKEAVRNGEGSIIMSKANAGTPATFNEVYDQEFKATELGAVADTKKVTTFVTPSANATTPKGTPQREVAPRH